MSIYGAALRELEHTGGMKRRACCFVCRSPWGLRYGGYGTTQPVTTGSGRPRNSSLAE